MQEWERLTPYTDAEVEVTDGTRGDEDEKITFQRNRADAGHVPSMIAMGNLLYYGARGLQRDQGAAFQYFRRAAEIGDPNAQTACGNMLLKGEGIPLNGSQAVEMYEAAAETNHSGALNGLGFLYYHGHDGAVEKNQTKAFELFDRGAVSEGRSDSLFNAGFCLVEGIGSPRNVSRGFQYMLRAANKGHFDAAYRVG